MSETAQLVTWWRCLHIQLWESRDRLIPRSPVAASLDYLASPRPMKPCAIKKKTAVEEQQPRLCTCAHVPSGRTRPAKLQRRRGRSSLLQSEEGASRLQAGGAWGSGLISGCWGRSAVYFFWVIIIARDLFPSKRERENGSDK